MFNHYTKMNKGKNIRVRFRIVDGKIHLKNLHVTPEEYEKIAETIINLVDKTILQNHNFNASINVII